MRKVYAGFILSLIVSFVSNFIPVSSLHAEDISSSDFSLNDHKAQIFKVEGSVKILKSSSADWVEAQKGMMLEAGDQILTGKDSHVEVSYDDRFLNIARIDQNTKAEFKSIEPTDLHLEDGAIFSALDGLKGVGYQISTPTAVAAVRGTHFDVLFDAATGKMDAAVIPDQQGHISHLELTPVVTDGIEAKSVMIEEGQQVGIEKGVIETPQALDPARIEANHEKLNSMKNDLALDFDQEETVSLPESESNPSSAEQKEDDQDKALPPGGGNDGGNNGGGPGNTNQGGDQENLNRAPAALPMIPQNIPLPMDKNLDAKVDAMVDTLIPRDDISAAGMAPKVEGVNPVDQRRDDKNTPAAIQVPATSAGREMEKAPSADLGRAMEFLQTGGAFDSRSAGDPAGRPAMDPTQLSVNMNGIFTNLGFDRGTSEKMATVFNTVADQMRAPDVMKGDSGGAVPVFAAPGGMTAIGGTMFTDRGAMAAPMTATMMNSGFVPMTGDNLRIDSATIVNDIAQMVRDTTQSTAANTALPHVPFEIIFQDRLSHFTNFAFLNQLFNMLSTTHISQAVNSPTFLTEALTPEFQGIQNSNGIPELSAHPADSLLANADIKLQVTSLQPDTTVEAEVTYRIINHQNQVVENGAGTVSCTTASCTK